MEKTNTTIQVSSETGKELRQIKLDNNFISMDEVILYLLTIKRGKGGRK